MERFNKYYTKLAKENDSVPDVTITTDNEAPPLEINEHALCTKCKVNLATHIGSYLTNETYLCDKCAVEYRAKHEGLPREHWFCEPFDQVRHIDATELPPRYTFGEEHTRKYMEDMSAEIKAAMTQFLEKHPEMTWPMAASVKMIGCAGCQLKGGYYFAKLEDVTNTLHDAANIRTMCKMSGKIPFLFYNEDDRLLYSYYH